MENNQKEISVGLDIGTTKIVAIVGRKNEYNKIEILGIGKTPSKGVFRGVVSNIILTIESIKKAVEEAQNISKYPIKSVMVGIAGQHIRSLQHSDYIIRSESDTVIDNNDIDKVIDQVKKLVMPPGEEIVHILPQEYKVDDQSQIKEPAGMYGTRLEANFHVVAGKTASIHNIIRCIKSSGLGVLGITLEPIASSSAVLSEEEKEAGVALVDIGGGTTDLAIFKNGIIRHTAVIPFGGNIITEDIKEGCSIIYRYAEQLKIKYGSVWPDENKDKEIVVIPGLHGRIPKEISLKNLSKIIHARVCEIFGIILGELESYGYTEQSKKLIAGIVITGGGSQLKHLKQLVEYCMGLDTRIGYPNEHIAGDSDREVANPVFSTSVGLLMHAINHRKTDYSDGKARKEGIDKKASIGLYRNKILKKWGEKLIKFLDKE